MTNSLQQIIDLINKTGDNCIVLDHQGNPTYVLMTLAGYQKLNLDRAKLAGLSEEELIDKINRDIASWKSSTQQEDVDNWQAIETAFDSIKSGNSGENSLNKAEKSQESESDDKSGDKKENQYYFEPVD